MTAQVAADLRAAAEVHTVTWHLDGPGGHAWPTFACTAPVGADCRLWCAAGCDERCENPDEHPTKDEGHCLPTAWLEAEGIGGECYNGPRTSPSNGPIEYVWDSLDECYEWHYTALEAAAAAAERQAAYDEGRWCGECEYGVVNDPPCCTQGPVTS